MWCVGWEKRDTIESGCVGCAKSDTMESGCVGF